MNENTVKLRDGSEVEKVYVTTTMMLLEELVAGGMKELMAFFDLVKLCRTPETKLSPRTIEFLQGMALLDGDGKPHDSVKHVVLSATKGSGIETYLVSPYPDPEPK